MADPIARLVYLPMSPWSERARWALDHHRVVYERVLHTPVIGELRLRRLVGAGRSPTTRATVPALILPDRILTESWDIVCYADHHGASSALLPSERLADVQRYVELADRGHEAGRALVTQRLISSPEALDETLPHEIPRWLRPWLRPVSRQGARWFAHKYNLSGLDTAPQLATLRATLDTLRSALARSSPYLLGAFSYADIAMATLLQGVSPVDERYIRLGPVMRQVWTHAELAEEYRDLVAWRDDLYDRHRPAPSA